MEIREEMPPLRGYGGEKAHLRRRGDGHHPWGSLRGACL
jgi:hypothetical protein